MTEAVLSSERLERMMQDWRGEVRLVGAKESAEIAERIWRGASAASASARDDGAAGAGKSAKRKRLEKGLVENITSLLIASKEANGGKERFTRRQRGGELERSVRAPAEEPARVTSTPASRVRVVTAFPYWFLASDIPHVSS